MRTYTFTLLSAFLTFCSSVFAQDYAFKVLANKGTNEMKTGDVWQPIKTGVSLKSSDEVKLGDNAYVGLVHATGKPLELKQAGSYKVSELSAKVGNGASVINKYTDFILSSNSAEAKKNRLSATGAVHRDVEISAIKLSLPEVQSSGVFNNVAIINWEGKVPGPYLVTLSNMFDEEIAKYETQETSLTVNLKDAKLASENALFVEVSSKADSKQTSKRHLIKKLTPLEVQNINASLNEISADVSEQTALNKYILAGFYEEHNLYIDAITAYEEAIKLAPDVPSYKEAYQAFLERHGL
ncbi:hypothetical protein [Chryseosolibacter indicus]|uniref:Tetratricopeptide repeat protein n=1 Tax=Chryseosolibacter indicus TaxID=2782351 RepID=A0ABS5VUH8_9BACT|nr:hypothetical protein [Chryseosolibacter indicus]MBT1705088.1 hypothetical protein [Chryseosolibacter indicus]